MKVDCSRVTHPFATAFLMYCYTRKTVRLACLNHAASVHSEPGSNSPKRVQNLVILELLNIVSRSSHLILLYLELLIGGPNQSYKVNFKEPSHEGKRVSKNSFGSSVNTFSKNFSLERSPGPFCTAHRASLLPTFLRPNESMGGATC